VKVAKYQKAVENAQLVVQMRSGAVLSFLEERKFKTRWTGGSSSGSTSVTARQTWEKNIFNGKYDGKDKMRPAYGHVSLFPDPFISSTSQYGPVALVMKPIIAHRATITRKDSANLHMDKARINKVLWAGNKDHIYTTMLENPALSGAVLTNTSKSLHSANYMEAQIHGGLRLEDVDHIIFNSENRSSKFRTIEEKCKTLGIRVVYSDNLPKEWP